MVRWVVSLQPRPCHFSPISPSLRIPCLCVEFSDSFPPLIFLYLPSSVPSSKFRIPQLLCLPLLRKLPGCIPTIPKTERRGPESPPTLPTSPKRRYDILPFAPPKVVSGNDDRQDLFGTHLLFVHPVRSAGSLCSCSRGKRAPPSRGPEK